MGVTEPVSGLGGNVTMGVPHAVWLVLRQATRGGKRDEMLDRRSLARAGKRDPAFTVASPMSATPAPPTGAAA